MDRKDIERQYATENAWIVRHGLKKTAPRGKKARLIQEQIQKENQAALEWLQRVEGQEVTGGDWLDRAGFLGTREFASIKSPSVGEEAVLAASNTSQEMMRPDRSKYVPPKSDDSDRDGDDSEFSPTCKSALYFDRQPRVGYGKPRYDVLPFWSENNFLPGEWPQWRKGFWFQGKPERTALPVVRVESLPVERVANPLRVFQCVSEFCKYPISHNLATIETVSNGPMGSKWETVSAGLLPRAGDKSGPINHGMQWGLPDGPEQGMEWLKRLRERDHELFLAVCALRDWQWPPRSEYGLSWRVLPIFKVPNLAWPIPKKPGSPPHRHVLRKHGQFRKAPIEVGKEAIEIDARRLRACGNELEALRLENRTVLEIAELLGISKRTAERRIAALEEAEYETETTIR